VKQEIAKEGIIPRSLDIATGKTTLVARALSRWQGNQRNRTATDQPTQRPIEPTQDHREQTPIAALGLHWLSTVFLIAVTAPLKPTIAYDVLTSLYAYVIILVLGFLLSGGLLLLHHSGGCNWATKTNFKPWVPFPYPLYALLYFLVCGVLLFAAFSPPNTASAFGVPWFIIPAIGISTPLWGVVWFGGLKARSWSSMRKLVVTRVPHIEEDPDDPGNYIQLAEVVDHSWMAGKASSPHSNPQSPSMNQSS